MLFVNEIFGPTIQGEGHSQGCEVMFLRLSFCNLKCGWCDTKYTWDWQNYSKKDEVHEMSVQEIVSRLRKHSVKRLVISGGEPMLQQQRILPLINELPDYIVEIETNGTVNPTPQFLSAVNQVNCSPKLANSGNANRENSKALTTLSQSSKVSFKFVVSSLADIDEIIYLTEKYEMKEVYLMPQAITREELASREQLVQELCRQHGFIYSTRKQIVLFGTKRAT